MTQTELLDTIRREIERRIKCIDACPFIEADFGAEVRREGKLQAYKDLLSFLDPLQELVKPLTVEDVVEQGKRFGRKVEIINHDEVTSQEPENPIYELNQFLINWIRDGQTDAEKDARWEAYRRFFELHDEAMMQEPEVEGLEEEVRKYLTNNFTPPGDKESFLIEDAAYTLWFDDVCHLARHFAEWGAKNAK